MMKKSKNVRLKQLLQLGTFVALIVLIAMVGAVMTNAEEVKYSEGLEFTSNGNGTCSVSGIGSCTDTEIVIPPESPDGEIVTHIEDWAISLTSEVTNIVIPNTVKSVDLDAFAHCYNLVSITFPASVTNINGSPLRFCYSLESIVVEEGNTVYHSSGNCLIETETKTLISGCQKSVIPTDGSVTKIGNMAFYNCLLTEAVEIPEGIVSIGDFAFQMCDGLVSVSIPDGVKEIGACAFGYCANLTEVKMTDSVKRMGAWAFSDCHKLEKIILSKNIQIIESGALSNTKITSIVFPPELTAIECEAFSQCAALRFVRIPDTVQKIDDIAFDGCHNLKAIVIPKSATLPSLHPQNNYCTL